MNIIMVITECFFFSGTRRWTFFKFHTHYGIHCRCQQPYRVCRKGLDQQKGHW